MSTPTTVTGNQQDYSFSQDGDNIAITEIDNLSNITQTDTTSQVVFTDGVTIDISTSINNTIANPADSSTYNPTLTALSDGGYILIWEESRDDQSSGSVQLRKYDATGTEIWKYSVSAEEVDDASIVELPDHSLLLSWGAWNDDTEVSSIYTQSLKPSDNIINGTLIKSVPPVTVTSKSGTVEVVDPKITLLENGKYLVSWQEETVLAKVSASNSEQDNSDGDADGFFTTYSVGIQGKIYPAGTSIPTLFTDSPASTDSNDYSIISNTASGGFWMATTTNETVQADEQPASYSASLYIREYDASGKLIPGSGTDLKNIESSYSNATYLTIQQVGTEFVASWIEEIQFAQPAGWFSTGRALMTQHYVVDGGSGKLIAEGAVAQISPAGPSINGSSITASDDGYILSWATYPITRGNIGEPDYATWPAQLFAQRFDQNGHALDADPILISTLTEGQYVMDSPIVEQLSDGGFITSWAAHAQQQNGDDPDISIYAQRFNAQGEPLGDAIITITGDANDNTLIWTGTESVTLLGEEGDDTLQGGDGDDLLDGGAGDDTARFTGDSQSYTLGLNAEGEIQVSTDEQTDTLDDIEQIQFVDGSIAIDDGSFSLEGGSQIDTETPAITTLTDGSQVVVWKQEDGLHIQRYDGKTLLGTTLVVDTADAIDPVISKLGEGFIVSWSQNYEDSQASTLNIQRFTADGQTSGTLTSLSPVNPDYDIWDISFTALTNGDYVMGWTEEQASINDEGVDKAYAQLFDANGQAKAAPIVIGTGSGILSTAEPSVAALQNGGFVVAWESEGTGENEEVYLQRFTANGLKDGAAVRVNTSTTGDQGDPEVVTLADGSYVVTWTRETHNSSDEIANCNIFMQRFSATGAKLGAETQANSTSGIYNDPAITALKGGGYVITWATSDEREAYNGTSSLYAQIFDKSGVKIGAELVVDSSSNQDYFPSISASDDGGFLIVWEAAGRDGSPGDILTKRFDASGNSLTLTGDEGNNTLAWASSSGVALDGGAGDDTLTSGTGNDTLMGGTGSDTLDGGKGNDVMAGGAGNDIYAVDNAKDSIIEGADAGQDTVRSSLSWTLAANLENLTLTGSTAINGTGNELDNVLIGNSAINTLSAGDGADTLDGKGGVDILKGGAGSDTYIVDLTATNTLQDTLTENLNEGDDTVKLRGGNAVLATTAALTLGANLEHLDASETGLSKLNITGNALNNTLTGNEAANILNGGAGTDTLIGGLGNDTYVIDNAADQIQEDADEGIDLVQVAIATAGGTYTLGDNLENATLTNAVAFNLTGNDANNQLKGNAVNNRIDGGLGVDSMDGGAGNDTYGVDNAGDLITDSAGIDTVEASIAYQLASTLENLTLTGSDTINGTGNALANILDGSQNSAANVLTGLAGNDTYVVGAGDSVVEALNGGTDLVKSTVDFELGDNLENLTLIGSGNTNATGNNAINTLLGNDGNNIIDGQGGVDILKGGAGSDTYIVDLTATNTLQDTLTENLNEGDDTVELRGGNAVLATTAALTLGANLEHLDASETGLTKLNITGNALNNTLTGNEAANILNGGAGTDTLIGGLGNDTYVIDNAADQIQEDADEGIDLVQVAIATAGGTYTLGDNLENATLTNTVAFNLTGNAADNTLTGNAANNRIDGGQGVDSMNGGAGNDTYVVDNAGDVITDSAGIDTAEASITYTLSTTLENLTLTGSDTINGTGNALANILDGSQNSAANVLTGLAGNDAYVVGAGDSVVEALNGGTDLVKSAVDFELGDNLENLTLIGSGNINATGNSMINTLIGNDGNNLLDGQGGADILKGGQGHDTYIVDLTASNTLQDSLTESLNEGDDTVQLRGGNALLATTAALTLGANLEHLDASETGLTKLNITGNALNNILTGNEAANILNGGAGTDTLIGGLGNDTYVIDNAADQIQEDADEGIDLVQVAIATAGGTYTLGDNLENATLTNTVAFNLTGNAADNTLTGNAANNRIDGGQGVDSMNGGAGNDTYVVDNAGDVITDSAGIDTAEASITYTLSTTLENLTLTGSDTINGTGNALANILDGSQNSAANVLTGLAGNDTYIVGAGDSVVEALNGGTDLVKSTVDFGLGNNLENLTLLGNGHIYGIGNDLINTLLGNDGNNLLDGQGGADILQGGQGDDTYIVDLTAAGKLQDSITELATTASYAGGIDSVVLRGLSSNTAAATLNLGLNLENLDASGTLSSKLNLTGNIADNVLSGNDADNIINGGAGNDTQHGGAGNDTLIGGIGNDTLLAGIGNDILIGGSGVDTMYGGAGNDTFRFSALGDLGLSGTQDVIGDFTSGDKLDLKALSGYSFVGEMDNTADFQGTKQVGYMIDGDDLVLYGNSSGSSEADFSIKLIGITELSGSDFIFS